MRHTGNMCKPTSRKGDNKDESGRTSRDKRQTDKGTTAKGHDPEKGTKPGKPGKTRQSRQAADGEKPRTAHNTRKSPREREGVDRELRSSPRP